MISLYFIIAVIVGSFALYSFIKKAHEKWSSVDTSDVALFMLAAFFVGLFWVITIWAALIRWAAEGETPYWFQPIKKLYKFVETKCRK